MRLYRVVSKNVANFVKNVVRIVAQSENSTMIINSSLLNDINIINLIIINYLRELGSP